jgi:hypothetical protein
MLGLRPFGAGGAVVFERMRMAQYGWGFDLMGMNWVDNLSWAMPGPDVAILRYEEDDRPPAYFFASAHLDDLKDPAAVASRASALKQLFDGALFLHHGPDFRPERLGDLIDLDADRRLGVYDAARSATPFSPALLAQSTPDDLDRAQAHPLWSVLYLARGDSQVRGMLDMLGAHGVTFVSLYALRDFMRTAGFGDEAIANAGGATGAELRTFHHTANNFAALGPAARHGETGHAPPATPMALERAAEIILAAARTFVNQRFEASFKVTA